MSRMIQRDEAFQKQGSFWTQLRETIEHGLADLATGFDRLAFDRLDPRVEGGTDGSFVLARGLAQAWRADAGHAPLPATILAGRLDGGTLRVREIPLEEWPMAAGLQFPGDGHQTVLPTGTLTRRIRGEGTRLAMEAFFGAPLASDELKGDFTISAGLAERDALLARAAQAAGVDGSGAVLLWLFQPAGGPVDILDTGGPVRNAWHPAAAAGAHLSHSFLTPSYAVLAQQPQADPWYDQATRDAVQGHLVAAGQERGVVITHRAVLDALAETSPLRKVLPHHLTRFFPEAERVFWCLNLSPEALEENLPGVDPQRWDLASPMERFNLLSGVKVAAVLSR